VYVQRVTEVTFETREYRQCSSCKRGLEAVVDTTGRGGGHGEEGLSYARGAGYQNARKLIRLAPCPFCGKRETGAVIGVWFLWLAAAVVFGGMLGGAGYFIVGSKHLPDFLIGAVIGAVLSLAIIPIELAGATRKVRFVNSTLG
jgi:hypothetical protein